MGPRRRAIRASRLATVDQAGASSHVRARANFLGYQRDQDQDAVMGLRQKSSAGRLSSGGGVKRVRWSAPSIVGGLHGSFRRDDHASRMSGGCTLQGLAASVSEDVQEAQRRLCRRASACSKRSSQNSAIARRLLSLPAFPPRQPPLQRVHSQFEALPVGERQGGNALPGSVDVRRQAKSGQGITN